jgi:hypothetical protein
MTLRPCVVGYLAVAVMASMVTADIAAASPVTGGKQNVQEVWLLGADTAWAWTESDTGPVSGGGGQAIALTTDGGVRWSKVTPFGMSVQHGKRWISGLFALNAKDAWVSYGGVGSQAGQKIAATTDGGRTWRMIGSQPADCELQFVSVRAGWCAAIGAASGSATVTLYRTTDGARDWQVVSRTPLNSHRPGALPYAGDKSIEFTSAHVGWGAVESPVGTAALFETGNAGRTWAARTVATAPGSASGGMFAGVPTIEGRYGAVGYSNFGPHGPETIVYASEDGGLSWRPVIPPGKPEQWLVDTLTAQRWRLVYGQQILATDNAGRTWRTIGTNHRFPALFSQLFSEFNLPVRFATAETGWVEQQNPAGLNTLWRTSDGGSDWQRVAIPGT